MCSLYKHTHAHTYWDYTFRKTDTQHLSIISNCSGRGGTLQPFPLLMLDFFLCLKLVQVTCMMSLLLCICTGICSAVQKALLQSSIASECYTLSASSSAVILSLGRRRSVCTFHLTVSAVPYSWHLGQFCVSVLTTIYCKQQLLYEGCKMP